MSKRTIKSIHFYNDRVITDYGDGKVFQFCLKCNHGKHLRAFLSHFCPQLDLSIMTEAETIAMERKFFNIMTHGPIRRLVNKEAYAFGAYVEKRFSRLQKQRN